MKIKIAVTENRQMLCAQYTIGTIGENNSTMLLFDVPKQVEDWQHFLNIETDDGCYVLLIKDGTLLLPSYVLTKRCFRLQFCAKKDSGEIWKSKPRRFTLNPTLDVSGENPITKAKAEQREDDRTELGETLSDLTGQDLKNSDWDELIDIANELPLKTEQNVLDLTNYSALTNAFEHAITAPSLLTGGFKLDKEDPDDPESAEVLIKLPYLNTRNVTNFGYQTSISNEVEECSFDISSSPNTNARYNFGMFQNGRANLRKLGLTGVEHINSLDSMFHDSVLEEIALYVDGEFIVPTEAYRTNFYRDVFNSCRSLKSVVGDKLDMSVTTTYPGTFKNCQSLRYVRFKPRSINGDLDLSDCPALMKGKYEASSDDSGTLISILNGVRDYSAGMNQITIKFSTFVKDYLTSWRCEQDPETGLYVAAKVGPTLATVLTNEKGVIIS